MSSLLQSPGRSTRERGHEIFISRGSEWIGNEHKATEPTTCERCHSKHEKLYRIWRKPRGMFGPWVLWRVNGADRPLDLSIPYTVDKIPRGAEPLTEEEAANYWHNTTSAN